jgi:hypothetical protein
LPWLGELMAELKFKIQKGALLNLESGIGIPVAVSAMSSESAFPFLYIRRHSNPLRLKRKNAELRDSVRKDQNRPKYKRNPGCCGSCVM